MSVLLGWWRRWLHRPGVVAHQATSLNLRSVLIHGAPQIAVRACYIGLNLLNGGTWVYDPWVMYGPLLTDPNMVLLGALGKGKSALVKSYLWRQIPFGRKIRVLDVKGEYYALAAKCGVEPVAIYPGGPWTLNPLDTSRHRGNDDEQRSQRIRILVALCERALKRELEPEERSVVTDALDDVVSGIPESEQPTLPMVVTKLKTPTEAMAAKSGVDVVDLKREARKLATGLKDLVDGELRGMFDGPTSPGLTLDGPLVVFDLSRMRGDDSLGILMTCLTALLTNEFTEDEADAPKMILVVEEAWRVLSDLGTARYFQWATKLSRKWGLQVLFVLHRLSDVLAAADINLVRGLIADCGTTVIYGQKETELKLTREWLHLSDMQVEMLSGRGRGQGLWLLGSSRLSTVVQHIRGRDEIDMTVTDERMDEAA